MRFEWDGQAVHELADLVVYQSIVRSGPADGKTLTGVECIMIDPRFADCRPDFNGPIVVAMGGSDPHGLTKAAIVAAQELGRPVVAVNGPAAPPLTPPLSKITGRVKHIVAPANMLGVFNGASLYLGAMGMMAYEAMAAGVPCALTNWSAEHWQTTQELEGRGAAINLGTWNVFEAHDARLSASIVLGNREHWMGMSLAGRRLVDGQGVRRVADKILEVVK